MAQLEWHLSILYLISMRTIFASGWSVMRSHKYDQLIKLVRWCLISNRTPQDLNNNESNRHCASYSTEVHLLNALKLCPSTIHNDHWRMGRTQFRDLRLFTCRTLRLNFAYSLFGISSKESILPNRIQFYSISPRDIPAIHIFVRNRCKSLSTHQEAVYGSGDDG